MNDMEEEKGLSSSKGKTSVWTELQRELSPDEIRFDPETLQAYAADRWHAAHLPEAVALPRSVESVSKILRFASAHRIPVTPRGAGHGYVGGCVPVRGGIVLSLERMDRVKEIHPEDFVAVVEAGVITGTLQTMAESVGLFYPPDPASRFESSIGGNIATNAGGPRCLKYGVTRDYVLGLEVVLADGQVIRLGGRTHKNKTGFELVRLFVGSEGLLGVITEATLKLLPLPPFRGVVIAGYEEARAAARAIQAVFARGLLPAALEAADEFTLEAARKYTGSAHLEGCRAMVLAELDGQEASVRHEMQLLQEALRLEGLLFLHHGLGHEACEELWQVRSEFSYALKATGLKKLNEDIVVPRGRLVDLFDFAAQLRKEYGIPIACFGHAGDGNIHTNIMIDKSDPEQVRRSEEILDRLFRQVIAWGGAITGEHGIGLAKRRWWPWAVSPRVRELHRQLKKVFDPLGILNPGKFVEMDEAEP